MVEIWCHIGNIGKIAAWGIATLVTLGLTILMLLAALLGTDPYIGTIQAGHHNKLLSALGYCLISFLATLIFAARLIDTYRLARKGDE